MKGIHNQSYSSNMFNNERYIQPIRRDRNRHRGGVLVYVREGIPCRELKINLRKNKWLLFAAYNNSKTNIKTFLENIGPVLDHYMCELDNFIILGDFNSEVHEHEMKEFCETYNLKKISHKTDMF